MSVHQTPVLITGTAGFIGFHLARLLLDRGVPVIGFDGMTDYYECQPETAAASDAETTQQLYGL